MPQRRVKRTRPEHRPSARGQCSFVCARSCRLESVAKKIAAQSGDIIRELGVLPPAERDTLCRYIDSEIRNVVAKNKRGPKPHDADAIHHEREKMIWSKHRHLEQPDWEGVVPEEDWKSWQKNSTDVDDELVLRYSTNSAKQLRTICKRGEHECPHREWFDHLWQSLHRERLRTERTVKRISYKKYSAT